MLLPEPMLRTEGNAVLDIADMIRRDGNRIYGACAAGCAYQSSLCGLTAGFNGDGDVMILKGHDLDAVVTLAQSPVDESDGIERYKDIKTDVSIAYNTGSAVILNLWHRHLSAYRRSMRSHLAAAA